MTPCCLQQNLSNCQIPGLIQALNTLSFIFLGSNRWHHPEAYPFKYMVHPSRNSILTAPR
ncbi:hypothetical protein I7I53_05879 [Histoplasma capsulatum var. duboisii H88]|uniref:Uncharacterized protein n=1 Tax=Ajellomyces capsulatus (strain H88) TaxID=544711 RepID=A0A8A1LFJ2_AJEC8|nr:hypothetical protein I7I53_05879 [Histoplasma capsulatum var. duboisii H88]